jgi:hypothetical protein
MVSLLIAFYQVGYFMSASYGKGTIRLSGIVSNHALYLNEITIQPPMEDKQHVQGGSAPLASCTTDPTRLKTMTRYQKWATQREIIAGLLISTITTH